MSSLNTKLQDIKPEPHVNVSLICDAGVYSLSLSPNDAPPSGQVLKLDMPAIGKNSDASFGTHIREAVDIVRDWTEKR